MPCMLADFGFDSLGVIVMNLQVSAGIRYREARAFHYVQSAYFLADEVLFLQPTDQGLFLVCACLCRENLAGHF